ncbi:MAG: DUF3604 domain-containing protein [Chloroflexi bacterium]|nr:DUF3604 domain-containing protein [Chloroflexota bacterium]
MTSRIELNPLVDLGEEQIEGLYGRATLSPAGPIIAGSWGTWQLRYTAGSYGIDENGTLLVAWRFASDWGKPQTSDSSAPNYVSARTDSRSCRVAPRWDPKGYIRPWRSCLAIDIFDGALLPGETITITYGDRSGGSIGTRAQTFVEKAFCFRTLIDAQGSGQYVTLPSGPWAEIVAGEAERLVAIVPSEAQIGRAFNLVVKAEDGWGNPASSYAGTIVLQEKSGSISNLPDRYTFQPADRGVRRIGNCTVNRPGIFTIRARSLDGTLAGKSNPLRALSTPGSQRPFWADLHGQSGETVGTNSVRDYFAFARDYGALDVSGHQANDFQITAQVWKEIKAATNDANQPGRFVAFVGYEWSGTTAGGGDRNVYFLGGQGELLRSSHAQISDLSDLATDRYPVSDLHEALAGRKDLFIIPHVGGRPSDLAYHSAALEPLVEVYSSWGEFEWMLRESIERGYHVGVVAGSDGHKGRPGSSYPGASTFGVYGGLTCILASELTRSAIGEALKARRCYATSGQRIIVRACCESRPIGSQFRLDRPPVFDLEIVGTAELEQVELWRGNELLQSWPAIQKRRPDQLRLSWKGARVRGRARMARWDGTLAVAGGRILAVEGYAFDSPAEGVQAWTPNSVNWRSITTGDSDGILVTLEAQADTNLAVDTPFVSTEISWSALGEGSKRLAAGGLDLELTIERRPIGLKERHFSASFRPADSPAGENAYWIRVLQADGAKAWTSPWYVTH